MSVDERLEGVLRQVFQDEGTAFDDSFSPETCPAWDSVSTINLMFMIEQEFQIQFVGAKFLDLRNVGEIRTYLARVAS